ncbi:MAG: glycosyltransferase [Nitrospirota bacterium]|nr:glycosyltransferase [Nitrospirota bacterium]
MNINDSPDLSIVIPVYNEAENITNLYGELRKTLDDAKITFEIIFVDDGSGDNSFQIIRKLSETDPRVRYASFSRNFGHEAASTCGFRMVQGRAAVLMDADMQDPAELIPKMISKWQEGYEVVHARRLSREGESFIKKATSYAFYRIINLFSDIKLPVDVGDFRLVDRKVVDAFNRFNEHSRYVRGLFSWVGYSQTVIDYNRLPRKRGKTKYNWLRLILLSMDALFGFSLVPLRLCIIFGIVTIVFSFIVAAVIVIQRLFLDLAIPGYALLTTGMFLLGGIQLTFLGVIGEYIGKIYLEVQGRPLFIIRESSPDPQDVKGA